MASYREYYTRARPASRIRVCPKLGRVTLRKDEEDDGMFDDELDTLNDPQMTHLPPPPVLTGSGNSTDMYGQTASAPIGRPVSPPLYRQAALSPQVTQLRVWIRIQGVPHGLGVVATDATEEDLIRTFFTAMPKPGEGSAQFILRPLDLSGNEIGQEFIIVISEHHAVLQRMRNAAAGSGGSAPMMGYMPPAQPDPVLLRTLEMAERRAAAMEELLRAERERIRAADAEMARERVDIAVNAATALQAMSEQMSEQDRQRAAAALELERARAADALAAERERAGAHTAFTSTFFQSQLEAARQERLTRELEGKAALAAQQQRFEQDMQRERERAKVEAEERRAREALMMREMDARLERERAELAAKAAAMAAELAERKRQEDQRAASLEAERQRQHEMRIKELEMAAQRDREHAERMMTLSTRDAKAADPMAMFGKALEFLKGAGIEPAELLKGLTGGGGAPWLEMASALAEHVSGVAEKAIDAKAQVQVAEAHARGQAARSAAVAQLPAYVPPEMAQRPTEPVPVIRSGQEMEPAPRTRLNLAAQKRVREALRTLAQQLSQTNPSDWAPVVAAALQNEGAIYHYFKDFGVRPALAETGADATLVENMCRVLQQSPALPGDVQF